MKRKVNNYIIRDFQNLNQVLAKLKEETPTIIKACKLINVCLKNNGKILLCGNGGSAAECQHIAAEFVGRFLIKDRKALPAIALTTDTSILTAVGNDFGYNKIFSRQIEALGMQNDVLIGYSTSGKSQNVIDAFNSAKKLKIKRIGITGLNPIPSASVSIMVESKHTPHIQTGHNIIGHMICDILERFYMVDENV